MVMNFQLPYKRTENLSDSKGGLSSMEPVNLITFTS